MTFMTGAHRAVLLVAGATSVCLALSACGDASTRASSGDMSEGTATSPKGAAIKIGYVASMSGPQSNNGITGVAVAHAWQEYTNAHGGILGHPVEIDAVDTKNTVPGATSVAKTFMQDKDVDAIFLTDLVAEGAMGSLFKDTDVPIISGGGSSDLLWSQVPGVFQDVSGSDYTIKAYVDVAKAAGATRFGWAACAEVAVCAANGT